MEFEEKSLEGFNTPVIAPESYEVTGVEDYQVTYKSDSQVQKDEPIFLHDESKVFLSQFRSKFENDSVIVLLLSPENNLYLHRRSKSKNWAPNKIDLASVVGQRRALIQDNSFQNEEIRQTAIREISEETGISREKLESEKLQKLGEHRNQDTKEYQTIFAYQLNFPLEKLNQGIEESDEVQEWFEQDLEQTLNEYFGDQVDKYAGGKELRPKNFISQDKIKENLLKFHRELK
jgi:ADP-ribose pyrophosphatase YjhB (NUDIX family)